MYVVVVLELILTSDADLVHHVVRPLDDVEGIDADLSVGEVFFATETKPLLMSQQKDLTCLPFENVSNVSFEEIQEVYKKKDWLKNLNMFSMEKMLVVDYKAGNISLRN